MALHIIIDGYNLIRNSPFLSLLEQEDLQTGREALVEMLAGYRRRKRHKITVVFDGTDAPGFFPARDKQQGVTVKFSRSGVSADTVIKHIAAKEKEKALVVSSDREIVDFAAAQGAATMKSDAFEARITNDSDDADGHPFDGEGDSWQPTTRKKGPARRLSKRERINRRKIEKL